MTRDVLDNRRMNHTVEIVHGAHTYTATIGYYLKGNAFRVGEVFLNSGKAGTELDTATRDSAVALSFALQHGCTPETMRAAFLRDPEGRPEGILGRLLDMICDGSVVPPHPPHPNPPPPGERESVALGANQSKTHVERSDAHVLDQPK